MRSMVIGERLHTGKRKFYLLKKSGNFRDYGIRINNIGNDKQLFICR